MDQYPTEEEELELRYQELEQDEDEPDFYGPSTSTAVRPNVNRKLNFSTNNTQDINCTPDVSIISNLESDFIQRPTHRAFSTPYTSARKRTINDLFGDIHDLEFSDAKKVKTIDEVDEEMIKKILEARRLNREKLNPLQQKHAQTLIRDRGLYRPVNISYEAPRWPFITITHTNNDRLYVRFHNNEYYKNELDEISLQQQGGLYSLKDKQEMWKEAKKLVNILLLYIQLYKVNAYFLIQLEKQDVSRVALRQQDNDVELVELSDNKLWVDVYRPKRYIELLSDEGTNRALLKWLKMWDKIVFNRYLI